MFFFESFTIMCLFRCFCEMSGALSTNLRLMQSLAFNKRCTTCFRYSFRNDRFLSSIFHTTQSKPRQFLSQRPNWSALLRSSSNLQASEEESHLRNIHEKYEQGLSKFEIFENKTFEEVPHKDTSTGLCVQKLLGFLLF